MGNWGRTRGGQVLTPKRRRLIRAYYARRPNWPWTSKHQKGAAGEWPQEWVVAYRQWRAGFMQPLNTKRRRKRNG